VVETTLLAGLPVRPALPLFVFFATWCSYNFHFALVKIYNAAAAKVDVASLPLSNMLFVAVGGAGVFFCYPYTGISLLSVMVALLCTLLYSLPLLPVKKIAFIRRAGFVKTLLLAFTWAYVTAYLPMAAAGHTLHTTSRLLLVQRFVFMLLLCIIFDKRDVYADAVKGFHSLATDISAKAVHRLLSFLFALLAVVDILLFYLSLGTAQLMALLLALAATVLVYRVSLQQRRGFVFYYLVVDGMMLLSALLTIMVSI
jgi:4-hydroxybenzoate polyprenyltransferase